MPQPPRKIRTLSAQIYPNGEFGLGFLFREKKGISEARFDRNESETLKRVEDEFMPTHELLEDGRILLGREKVMRFTPKLGSSHELSQPKKKYGKSGITAYGRKMVRNCGYAIDCATKGKFNYLPQMGTLTLPSYSPATMKRITEDWGNLTRKFFQEIKRIYARLHFRFDCVHVTEVQPRRWADRAEVGLHLHFIYVGIRLGRNKWVLSDNRVREVWRRLLEGYLGEDDISGNPNYRREAVRTSCAAYLAKYLSKGGVLLREISERHGEAVLPSQWWGVTSLLRRAIRSTIQKSRGVVASALLNICEQPSSELIKYVREVTICSRDRGIPSDASEPFLLRVGYGGMLSPLGTEAFSGQSVRADIRRYLRYPCRLSVN